MSTEREVQNYLAPPKGAFWTWSDDNSTSGGPVLTWTEGPTIAFVEEVRTVCAHLAPSGLPSFGAIALLLAGMRSTFPRTAAESRALMDLQRHATVLIKANKKPNTLTPPDVAMIVREVASFLGGLPADVRDNQRLRAVLVEKTLEHAIPRTSPELANHIVQALRPGLTDLLATARQREYNVRDLWQGFGPLSGLSERVTVEQLRNLARTGIDDVEITPTEIELPPCERARQLISDLHDDDDLAGVARIARRLLSLTSLPHPHSNFNAPPVGGYSDITNRGSLDRLLVSELANDDLTLATRVAMNEAMYLRREVPPSSPPQHRALLLDCGIRSWGLPRIYITSVALAFVATAPRDASIAVYGAKADSLRDIDLISRDGLVDHLATLEPDLNAAQAVNAYETAVSDNSSAEPIFLMAADAWQDPEVRQSVLQSRLSSIYVATVNRNGEFCLWHRTAQGIKAVRQATLDLKKLLTKRTADALQSASNSDLPAIYRVHPFPLLMPHPTSIERQWPIGVDGVLALATDGRVMQWTSRGHGARELGTTPARNLQWVSPLATNGILWATAKSGEFTRLLKIDLAERRVNTTNIQTTQPYEVVCQYNDILLFVGEKRVESYDLKRADWLPPFEFPTKYRWISGRFFRHDHSQRWFVVVCDGAKTSFEFVVKEGENGCPNYLSLMVQPADCSPFGVTHAGSVYCSSTQETTQPLQNKGSSTPVWNSPDERFVGFAMTDPSGRAQGDKYIVDILTGESWLCPWQHQGKFYPTSANLRQIVQPQTLRHKFTEIGITKDRRLAMRTRKATLHFQLGSHAPVFTETNHKERLISTQPFEPANFDVSERVKYWVAEWPNGSRAVVDSRGLLHLRSADSSVPETTIVLRDGMTSGWCSTPGVWGTPYFISDAMENETEKMEPHEVYKIIGSFVRSLGST